MNPGDTIAAISSAVGPAARIIVRMSGPEAHRITADLTVGELPSAGEAGRVILQFRGLRVPAWVYLFQSPRSYTGDHMSEFHLPGSPLLASLLLEELLRRGARPAEPGEFTARAYFNGRLDLTEAEGVAAAVSAGSERELSAARRLMAGELARRVMPIIDEVAQILALVEVGIDFSDEDVTFLGADAALEAISRADHLLETLLRDSVSFERLAHEPCVVLVGRPNAGKSTLLNALAGHQRAIVSPIAGTTRDALSARIALRRGFIHLTDVAGIDDEASPETAPGEQGRIERLMREGALRAVQSADAVVLVRDALDTRPDPPLPAEPSLVVLSKIDQLPSSQPAPEGELPVSALTSCGLEALKDRLDALAFGEAPRGESLALNARHVSALGEARTALARATNQVRSGPELLALELRDALDALGQVTGHVSPDDLLGRIFSSFCIGK